MNTTVKTVAHGIASGIAFAIPFIILSGHTYTDLTIGAVLTMIYHAAIAYNSTPTA